MERLKKELNDAAFESRVPEADPSSLGRLREHLDGPLAKAVTETGGQNRAPNDQREIERLLGSKRWHCIRCSGLRHTRYTTEQRATMSLSVAAYAIIGDIMLGWAVTFFFIAAVAAIFGFTSVAVGAASIARIVFSVFAALFALAVIAHFVRGLGPRV